MRAWIEEIDDDTVAMVHGVDGSDLDTLATYCREAAESQKSNSEMKLAASVDGTVILDWCNRRGITWQQFMADQALQARFLDDPVNLPFRVWKGRI
ncbi:hypothetical protein ACYX7E_09935 [Luteimonas sp. RIT-PG2_3]